MSSRSALRVATEPLNIHRASQHSLNRTSRDEVVIALVAACASVVLVIAGLIWRKMQPALLVAAVILAFAVPPRAAVCRAYPTTFYRSPTDFAATAIVHGAKAGRSKLCHLPWTGGLGDSPAANRCRCGSRSHRSSSLAHSEGDLFWFVSNGPDTPEGQPAMPGFPVSCRVMGSGLSLIICGRTTPA